jgi:hypothetical protein
MAVDVPDRAEFVMEPVARIVEHMVVRGVVARDTRENVIGAKLAIVYRDARLRMPPDEADAGDGARL